MTNIKVNFMNIVIWFFEGKSYFRPHICLLLLFLLVFYDCQISFYFSKFLVGCFNSSSTLLFQCYVNQINLIKFFKCFLKEYGDVFLKFYSVSVYQRSLITKPKSLNLHSNITSTLLLMEISSTTEPLGWIQN